MVSAPTAPKPFTHLTVIPDRHPVPKAHVGLGHAKNAVRARLQWGKGLPKAVQVYELVDGEWKLLWDIPEGTMASDFPWKQ